jgi:hypothetical protein
MDQQVLGGVATARRLELGPSTKERACRVLEQQLGAVWAAVLESHGLDPARGFRVRLEGLSVAPGPPESPPNGSVPDAER